MDAWHTVHKCQARLCRHRACLTVDSIMASLPCSSKYKAMSRVMALILATDMHVTFVQFGLAQTSFRTYSHVIGSCCKQFVRHQGKKTPWLLPRLSCRASRFVALVVKALYHASGVLVGLRKQASRLNSSEAASNSSTKRAQTVKHDDAQMLSRRDQFAVTLNSLASTQSQILVAQLSVASEPGLQGNSAVSYQPAWHYVLSSCTVPRHV